MTGLETYVTNEIDAAVAKMLPKGSSNTIERYTQKDDDEGSSQKGFFFIGNCQRYAGVPRKFRRGLQQALAALGETFKEIHLASRGGKRAKDTQHHKEKFRKAKTPGSSEMPRPAPNKAKARRHRPDSRLSRPHGGPRSRPPLQSTTDSIGLLNALSCLDRRARDSSCPTGRGRRRGFSS